MVTTEKYNPNHLYALPLKTRTKLADVVLSSLKQILGQCQRNQNHYEQQDYDQQDYDQQDQDHNSIDNMFVSDLILNLLQQLQAYKTKTNESVSSRIFQFRHSDSDEMQSWMDVLGSIDSEKLSRVVSDFCGKEINVMSLEWHYTEDDDIVYFIN